MKQFVHFATSLPFAVALVVVVIGLAAILTQYPGSINMGWGRDGGIFQIQGSPDREGGKAP
jgi:hypothetical protein